MTLGTLGTFEAMRLYCYFPLDYTLYVQQIGSDFKLNVYVLLSVFYRTRNKITVGIFYRFTTMRQFCYVEVQVRGQQTLLSTRIAVLKTLLKVWKCHTWSLVTAEAIWCFWTAIHHVKRRVRFWISRFHFVIQLLRCSVIRELWCGFKIFHSRKLGLLQPQLIRHLVTVPI